MCEVNVWWMAKYSTVTCCIGMRATVGTYLGGLQTP